MTLVLKFGGAAVASPEHFSRVADIVIERRKVYHDIVIVVSAMADKTDELIGLAHRVCPDPPRREYDMLISVGERISISLLAMALWARGCEAVSFTGSQSGIITCSQHSDARIIDVKPRRVQEALSVGKVAIVAGFQGVSEKGEITTLGRGGSDTSAVALASALKMDVEFFKDVDGIYAGDPKEDPSAQKFFTLSYHAALELAKGGAKVLQERSVHLAKKNGVKLKVTSFNQKAPWDSGTEIYDPQVTLASTPIYESYSRCKLFSEGIAL